MMEKIRLHFNGNKDSLNSAFLKESKNNGNIWKVLETGPLHVKVVSHETSLGYWWCGLTSFSYERVYDEIILPKELFEI